MIKTEQPADSDKKWLFKASKGMRYHYYEEYFFIEKLGLILRDKHTPQELETARQQALAELKKSKGIK